jgi:type IV pilus assembly protein PilQ
VPIARYHARRLFLSAAIVAWVAGCQSAAPPRQSIDDILQEAAANQRTYEEEARLRSPRPEPRPETAANQWIYEEEARIRSPRPEPRPDFWLAGYESEAVEDEPFRGTPQPQVRLRSIVPERLPPARAVDQPRVNEIFEETDVRQAVQSLAVQANVSVILDEQVSGLTSAVIENEPFESALRKVLLPLGCIYRKHEGQYLVGVPDPQSSLFPLIAERFDYQARHLSPEELTALLPERYKKYLRVMDKRSRIVVEAPAEAAQQIFLELERADQPVPQVLLEVLVCVFSPEARLRFGLNLEHGALGNGGALQSLKLQDLAFTGTVSPAALGGMFSDFAVTSHFLQMLAQEGYVKIRAAPRVMAKDGERAEISIGRESYFSIQPEGADVFFRQDIEKVEAGISLDILPVIRGDNVTVIIERAEVSEDVRSLGEGAELASPYPVINRRIVKTTVHVKDGQTIVIGGLNQTQIVDRLDKVPFFGDLPLIGWMFRRIDKQEQEAEVVIFISPQIVTAPEDAIVSELDPTERAIR